MLGKRLFIPLGIAAAFIDGLALKGMHLGQQPWFISRASGLVAFAILSSSVILGLLMSTKAANRWLNPKVSYELHGTLSVLSLIFLAIHGGALLFDGFFSFTPASLVIPFLSPYQPLWVGLGVIAAWTTAGVAASVRFRKQMGYARWRQLHYLSFVAYVLSLVHGMTAGGTDTSLPLVQALYLGSAATIATLLMVRILFERPARAARKAAARPQESLRGLAR